MTLLDENEISPAENRKGFLDILMRRGSQVMETSGLSEQLNSARNDLMAMFARRAETQFPRRSSRRSLVEGYTRERYTSAMIRSIAEAGVAIGATGSPERERQLLKLWKLNLGRLHTIIPHDNDRKPSWLALMNKVAEGKSYAAFLLNKKQKQTAESAGRHPLMYMLRQYRPDGAEEGDEWMWDDELVQKALSARGRDMFRARQALLPADYFSSEQQRDRALRTTRTFHGNIHNIPVTIPANGRFYVYYQDPGTNSRHIFRMYHKGAYSVDAVERNLVVTATGLAIVDERGEYIPFSNFKGTSNTFLNHNGFSSLRNGHILKQAWQHALQSAGVGIAGDAGLSHAVTIVDEAGEAGTAGPSQTAMDVDDVEAGLDYASDTTVHSLALRLYNGNESIATRNLSNTGRNPSSYKYTLPVHISDTVAPFKRFLDDRFPNGGRIFLSNPTFRLPASPIPNLFDLGCTFEAY
ncbi:hypothetical protein VKS41_000743 [Umbelopsis sp. WA50703]